MTGSIILKMAFGYSVKVGKDRDELLHLVEEATNSFILSTSAGAFMADVFPIRAPFTFVNGTIPEPSTMSHACAVRYVPSWLSLTAWKRKVREWSEILDKMHDLPYEYAEATAVRTHPFVPAPMALIQVVQQSDGHTESFVARNLSFAAKSKKNRYHLKVAAGSMYSGGADTVNHPVLSLFYICQFFPNKTDCGLDLDIIPSHDQLP